MSIIKGEIEEVKKKKVNAISRDKKHHVYSKKHHGMELTAGRQLQKNRAEERLTHFKALTELWTVPSGLAQFYLGSQKERGMKYLK